MSIPKPLKERRKRHKQTIACDISPKVRAEVNERDSVDGAPCCILCGDTRWLELAHVIPRSQSGKGIPENLVVLCKSCHYNFDTGNSSWILEKRIEAYLKQHYPDWDRSDLVYNKFNK